MASVQSLLFKGFIMEQNKMTYCEMSYNIWMRRNKGKGSIKEKKMFQWAFNQGMEQVMEIFQKKLNKEFRDAKQEGVMRNVWRIEEFKEST